MEPPQCVQIQKIVIPDACISGSPHLLSVLWNMSHMKVPALSGCVISPQDIAAYADFATAYFPQPCDCFYQLGLAVPLDPGYTDYLPLPYTKGNIIHNRNSLVITTGYMIHI